VFGAQLEAMVRAGTSLIVGTVGPDGTPRATRAWAARVVDPTRCRIRFVMAADDEVAVSNLGTGAVALTGAEVATLTSTQMKGRVVAVEEATDVDVSLMDEHSTAFFDAVNATDGNPVWLLRRLLPTTVVAVELEVDEVFDQSPGPAAGAPVPAEAP
jgi:hypothetical protein